MTDPCPRCAELEARLAAFERETFEALRARVRELEAAIREIRLMSVPAGYDSGHVGITEVCKRVLEPAQLSGTVSAAPTGNPTAGTFMWIDQNGTTWIRSNDGTVTPYPLLKEKK